MLLKNWEELAILAREHPIFPSSSHLAANLNDYSKLIFCRVQFAEGLVTHDSLPSMMQQPDPNEILQSHQDRLRTARDAFQSGETKTSASSIFDLMIASPPAGILRVDRQQQYLFVNQWMSDVTGIPPTEFVGKTCRELGFPAQLCDRMESAINSVFSRGLPTELEFVIATPEGQQTHWLRFAPEFDQNNEIGSVLIFLHDTTEYQSVAETLIQDKKPKPLLERVRNRFWFFAPNVEEKQTPGIWQLI